MRNPNRLDNFYITLRNIHKEYFPDWRFGQFIYNFLSWYGDPFFLEESAFIKEVEKFVKEVIPNAEL